MADKDKIGELLKSDLNVINVGLEGFAADLRARGVDVVHVDWTPPAGGNAKLAALLSKLGS
jgi:FdrA protein